MNSKRQMCLAWSDFLPSLKSSNHGTGVQLNCTPLMINEMNVQSTPFFSFSSLLISYTCIIYIVYNTIYNTLYHIQYVIYYICMCVCRCLLTYTTRQRKRQSHFEHGEDNCVDLFKSPFILSSASFSTFSLLVAQHTQSSSSSLSRVCVCVFCVLDVIK